MSESRLEQKLGEWPKTHTLESTRIIVATVLYYKGRLRPAAEELGYADSRSLSKRLKKLYGQYSGLKQVIETAREMRGRDIPPKSVSNRRFCIAQYRRRRATTYSKRKVISTLLQHRGRLKEAAGVLGYKSASSLSAYISKLYSEYEGLQEILRKVRQHRRDYI